MGLLDSAYWASHLAGAAVMGLAHSALLIGLGNALRFELFVRNSFALQVGCGQGR